MAGYDPGVVAKESFKLALGRFIQEIDSLVSSNQAVSRRGAQGLLESNLTSAQKTAERKRLLALAQTDPDAYSRELRQMIKRTSMAETMEFLLGGKNISEGI